MADSKNNKRLVIGVDLDDVVFSFNDAFHAYHNAKYGTNVLRKDLITYDMEKIMNCTLEEAKEKVLEFVATPEHADALPVAGATKALVRLSRRHSLHIITARGEQIEGVTVKWVEKNFPRHFESINLTNQFFDTSGKAITKIDVCKRLGIELMIEDSPRNARQLAEAGVPVILLDAPWNQREMPENVTRVYSWAEIAREIDARSA